MTDASSSEPEVSSPQVPLRQATPPSRQHTAYTAPLQWTPPISAGTNPTCPYPICPHTHSRNRNPPSYAGPHRRDLRHVPASSPPSEQPSATKPDDLLLGRAASLPDNTIPDVPRSWPPPHRFPLRRETLLLAVLLVLQLAVLVILGTVLTHSDWRRCGDGLGQLTLSTGPEDVVSQASLGNSQSITPEP